MKDIDPSVAINGTSSFKKRFFIKLFFYTLLFPAVFSTHFFYGGQSSETLSLGRVPIAFASPEVLSLKGGAGHRALLDINKASSDELMALPGIGPKLSERIMKDREANGPFPDADALLRVKGIGPKRLEKMSPFLQFESINK